MGASSYGSKESKTAAKARPGQFETTTKEKTKLKKELRITASAVQLRTSAGNSGTLSGYAAKFNKPSQDLGGFVEVIKPGAFKRTLAEGADVRALINHDPNKVLGRSTSGTLRLSEDEVGLRFECDLPDTSYARDLRESIKRGDVTQCSFGFYCRADEFSSDGSMRTVKDVDLFDVSAVTYPAYLDTQVSARSRIPNGPAVSTVTAMEEERQSLATRIRLALIYALRVR